ncbi:MAG: ferritin [Actinomycetota bacterium]|jgi:ferritin|nr:ferritin [Actinomycetota bacterium]
MAEITQTPMKGAVREAMEAQVGNEFHAAYLYLSMAGSFEVANFPGFAHWMRSQAKEEVEHATKFFDFLIERGESVQLPAIPAPTGSFRSPLDAFEQSLAHEKKVTAQINDIYAHAVRENDYPAQVLLHWFIEEQVEEEASASQIVERLRMAGDEPTALLMLDSEMKSR